MTIQAPRGGGAEVYSSTGTKTIAGDTDIDISKPHMKRLGMDDDYVKPSMGSVTDNGKYPFKIYKWDQVKSIEVLVDGVTVPSSSYNIAVITNTSDAEDASARAVTFTSSYKAGLKNGSYLVSIKINHNSGSSSIIDIAGFLTISNSTHGDRTDNRPTSGQHIDFSKDFRDTYFFSFNEWYEVYGTLTFENDTIDLRDRELVVIESGALCKNYDGNSTVKQILLPENTMFTGAVSQGNNWLNFGLTGSGVEHIELGFKTYYTDVNIAILSNSTGAVNATPEIEINNACDNMPFINFYAKKLILNDVPDTEVQTSIRTDTVDYRVNVGSKTLKIDGEFSAKNLILTSQALEKRNGNTWPVTNISQSTKLENLVLYKGLSADIQNSDIPAQTKIWVYRNSPAEQWCKDNNRTFDYIDPAPPETGTHPSIPQQTASYDGKNPSKVEFNISLGDGDYAATGITQLKVNGTEVNTGDYSIAGGKLQLSDNYLQSLNSGSYTIDAVFNDKDNTEETGKISLVVTNGKETQGSGGSTGDSGNTGGGNTGSGGTGDSGNTGTGGGNTGSGDTGDTGNQTQKPGDKPSVNEIITYQFYKDAQKPVIIPFKINNSEKLSSIYIESKLLTEGTDYTYDNELKQVIIKESVLGSLTAGSYRIIPKFDTGDAINNIMLDVFDKYIDRELPYLLPSRITYTRSAVRLKMFMGGGTEKADNVTAVVIDNKVIHADGTIESIDSVDFQKGSRISLRSLSSGKEAAYYVDGEYLVLNPNYIDALRLTGGTHWIGCIFNNQKNTVSLNKVELVIPSANSGNTGNGSSTGNTGSGSTGNTGSGSTGSTGNGSSTGGNGSSGGTAGGGTGTGTGSTGTDGATGGTGDTSTIKDTGTSEFTGEPIKIKTPDINAGSISVSVNGEKLDGKYWSYIEKQHVVEIKPSVFKSAGTYRIQVSDGVRVYTAKVNASAANIQQLVPYARFSKSLPEGSTYKIRFINRSKGKKYTYTSSDAGIASVNKYGTVKVKKVGTVKITATARNKKGNVYKHVITIKCTKGKAVTDTSKNLKNIRCSSEFPISRSYKTLKRGRSYTFKIKADKKIKYRTGNKRVATVNSKGKITALKAGRTNITAVVRQNGKTYKFKMLITVK